MKKKLLIILTASVSIIGISSFAGAVSYDFESGSAPAEISGGNTTGTSGYSSYGFGNYFQWSGGNAITMDLSGLDTHTTLDLEFDLAIIDSWDGSTGGWNPDYFNVTLDGDSIFKETFDNFHQDDQSYTGAAITWGTNLYGISSWHDSAYHITLSGLAHSASTLQIKWFADGNGWQGGQDESFAIDNIDITTNGNAPVPEPATMFLFGTGLIGLAGSRLKRKKK